jgi:hypothetical protein
MEDLRILGGSIVGRCFKNKKKRKKKGKLRCLKLLDFLK